MVVVLLFLLPPPQPPLADVGGDGPPSPLLRIFPLPATDPPKIRLKWTNSWTSLLDLLLLRALLELSSTLVQGWCVGPDRVSSDVLWDQDEEVGGGVKNGDVGMLWLERIRWILLNATQCEEECDLEQLSMQLVRLLMQLDVTLGCVLCRAS